MPRRSRPSGRPSTTSPRTSNDRTLGELIDELPAERAAAVFTHSSWAADRTASYERLEFLGDSVLELAVARALYDRFPDFTEGRMAKIRSHVVSRASCAVIARELGLGERLRHEASALPPDEVERLAGEGYRAFELVPVDHGGMLDQERLGAARYAAGVHSKVELEAEAPTALAIAR